MAENMKTVICEQCGFELSIDPENIQSSLPTLVNSVRPSGAERSWKAAGNL